MSDKAPLRVVITGAAGQIAYSLLYQVASGYVFGMDQVGDEEVWGQGFLSHLFPATRSAPA